MFRNQFLKRVVSSVVLVTFTSLTFYPLSAAAQQRDAAEKAGLLRNQKDESVADNFKRFVNGLGGKKNAQRAVTSDERLGQLLNDIHEHLKAVVPETSLPKPGKPASVAKAVSKPTLSETDVDDKVKRIRSKNNELKALYADIEQSFKDTEQRLKDAKLPQVILDRHNAAFAQYQSRKAEFARLTAKVEDSDDSKDKTARQVALADLGAFMAKHPNAKPHQYTDPNKLPFRTNDGKVRAPYTTKTEYQANLFPPKYEKVMLAGAIPDGLKLAQAALPQIPTAADLAETDDVQITQAIRDQVAAIAGNPASPVKIYNWVRNNIAFIPSYGSIQGSDLTLQNRRGNAFDTASLLIAMYRAAGINARYQYGTIELSAERAMNWVGGVSKPEAVLSLLGQGGIPSIGIVSSGKISTIRMEHVWVEAYVDYTPSRGAVNRNPNTWVPVDPSFKQYTFTQGMDIKTNVPLDSQTLLTQIQQGATVDATQGYVQNLNQANLQTQMTAYQTQVKNYIDSQKANATMGDVLGTQTIKPENYSILMGTLPYKTVATGSTFQTLPDNLRWKFKTNIYAADGVSDGSSPIIEINQSTSKLAGKKITSSFIPATQADQDFLNSYLPKPHTDGTPIQPSELPTSFPGYLLKMKVELRIDAEVVAQSATSFTMGSEVKQSNQYFNPSTRSWEGGEDNDIVVGEYNAIGIDLQGISAAQLRVHQDKMEATKTKLQQYQQNPNDTTPIDNLTKENFTGDLVYSGILGYFAKVDSNDAFAARTAGNVVTYRLPSYGRYFTAVQPSYWFGIVRSVTFPGAVMDVDFLKQHTETKNDNKEDRIASIRQFGAAGSAAEHEVSEAMFRNPDLAANDPTQPQGVSAVKALAIAAAQGQKIYTLNQSNQSLHNTVLQTLQISQDVKWEIANALTAGKEVTVHEKDISIIGWTGSGFVILDPETGAGAYKIGGGFNGAWIPVDMIAFTMGTYFVAFLAGAALLNPVGLLILGISLIYSLYKYVQFVDATIEDGRLTNEQKANMISVVSFLTAFVNAIAGSAAKATGEVGAVLGGMLIGVVSTMFKKINDGLANILGNKE